MTSIYILGAGAMGSLWATHLHLALTAAAKSHSQYSVRFLSTREHLPEKINISLNSPFLFSHLPDKSSQFDINISVVNAAELNAATPDNPNIILLCTKSFQALDAAQQLKPYLNEHCYLVLFQNGLGSQYKIVDVLQTCPIFAAVSTEGVNKQDDGSFIHAGKGLTRVGALNDKAKNPEVYKHCINALSYQGLAIEAEENIWRALWEKLAINCAINPFTAILDCPNGKIKDSALFQESWPALNKELTEMLNTANVEISSAELEQRVFQVIQNTQSNISSMLQDVRAKRKTEIEDINGFAARYLESNKLKNNINSMLYTELNKHSL